MKIFALQADDQACGTYRVALPAQYAEEAGVRTEVSRELPGEFDIHTDGSITVIKLDIDADVLIFQRPLRRVLLDVLDHAQRKGIACVVEIDDDLTNVDPHNQAYHAVQSKLEHWKYLVEACKRADWVTCSTDALAERFGKHGRVSVVRNTLPEWVFDIEKTQQEPPRVGWTGSLATHPYDLQEAGSHIGVVLRQTGAEFSMLGDSEGVREALRLSEWTTVNETEWVALEKYHQTLADSIDIGIVPLARTPFNDAKSWLKGLEMAGVGIPFVASPTREYEVLAALGAGRIARKGIEWQKHLARLIDHPDYLLEESDRVRQAVRPITYANAVERWVDAWMSAVEVRQENLR